MVVNSLPKTVTRQRRDCDLNPGPSAPEFSTLTTRLPSHPVYRQQFAVESLIHLANENRTLKASLGPVISIRLARVEQSLHTATTANRQSSRQQTA